MTWTTYEINELDELRYRTPGVISLISFKFVPGADVNLLDLARSALATNALHPDVLHGASPGTVDTEHHDDPASDRRRERVIAMLSADPNLRIALVVDDPDADPVRVMVGIRHVAVGELEIPAIAYDFAVLVDLLNQHGAEAGGPR